MTVPVPTHIKIGPYTFEVTDDKVTLAAMLRTHKLAKGCLGITDSRLQKIALDPDQSAANKRDTLWHEVKHCAWRYLNWDTPKNMTEEEIIWRGCTPELDALRRNPDLVAYLLEADE